MMFEVSLKAEVVLANHIGESAVYEVLKYEKVYGYVIDDGVLELFSGLDATVPFIIFNSYEWRRVRFTD